MNIKYCLPIIMQDSADIERIIQANLEKYTYFEVWLDYLQNPNDEFLSRLEALLEDRLIILFRRRNLEPIVMSLEARTAILQKLHKTEVKVDLDISTQTQELQAIKDLRLSLRLITSYHNYQSTPDNNELNAIIESMLQYSPVIYKVATYCQDVQSVARLLELIGQLKKVNRRFIIVGMGQHGIAARICGALFGNEFNFAPLRAEENSADGQLTLDQFTNIMSTLGA